MSCVDGWQALEELKPLVKEPRGSKQRMTDSLVDNATVAFKIGELVVDCVVVESIKALITYRLFSSLGRFGQARILRTIRLQPRSSC